MHHHMTPSVACTSRSRSTTRSQRGAWLAAATLAGFLGTAATAQCTTQWATSPPFGTGLNGPVKCVLALPNGDLVAGGDFTTAGGTTVNRIARWDGTNWNAMGSGMSLSSGGSASVYDMTLMPNGDIVAGGMFTHANGVPCNSVARWNGSTWSPMAGGFSLSYAQVHDFHVTANGQLYALVHASLTLPLGILYLWTGTSWNNVDNSLALHSRSDLFHVTSGELVVGHAWDSFYPVALMRRSASGGTFQPFGAPWPSGSSVNAFAQLPNGDLVVGGSFTSVAGIAANNIARWNGTSWSPLGAGTNATVNGLTPLPNGDLVAVGSFASAGGVAASRIARWNGSAWSAMGGTVAGTPAFLNCATMTSDGSLVTGGSFTTAGGVASANLAQLTTSCPATAISNSSGCSGPGSLLVLTASSLPWIGSTYTARVTGLAAGALALEVLGWSAPGVPLGNLHPLGEQGCTLLASADLTRLLVPTAGAAATSHDIPNAAFLIGAPLHHQVLQLQLDPAQTPTGLNASNSLSLSIGKF